LKKVQKTKTKTSGANSREQCCIFFLNWVTWSCTCW